MLRLPAPAEKITRTAGIPAAILDATEDAILVKDLSGVVIAWNRGAERMYGYGAAEMVGRSMAILVPPDRRQEYAEIREIAPDTVVLMMTAYGDSHMQEEALALGARVVIDKPFQVEAVISMVESPPPSAPVPHV